MVIYVPGTEETDPKKQNISLQQIGGGLSTATTNIATNTTNIATNTSAISSLQTAGQGLVNSSGSLAVSLANITASLGADVAMNNTANYFDGPSIAQGTAGTWFVSGSVTCTDTAASARINAKLWDGTTIIASGSMDVSGANANVSIALSGYIASPVANLRISVRDSSSTNGKILFNYTGSSKDSTLSAVRIA